MKLLLFDLDGTLVRAGGAGGKALNRAIYTLYGKRVDCAANGLAGKTDLRNFSEAIRSAVGRRPKRPELERVHAEYLKILPRFVAVSLRAKRYALTPGILRLLRRLRREKDVLLGLGTGNMERGARIKLEPAGLNEFFAFGGYGSDAYQRPALLRKAHARAERLAGRSIRSRDVYVIGDTPLDVAAGKKAGFRTIAVGTGFSQWAELVESRPTFLARDFRRVGQWLNWLGLARGKSPGKRPKK